MTDEKQREFDTIAPADVHLSAASGDPDQDGAMSPASARRWLLAGLALMMLLGLVWLLPDALRPDTAEIARAPATDSGPADASGAASEDDDNGDDTPAVAPVDAGAAAPFEARQRQRARESVEDLIAELLDRQEALQAQAVERWGEAVFTEALEQAEAGDRAFMDNAFDTAEARYQGAIDKLKTLQVRAPETLAQALEEGQQALDLGDAETARNAFELALAIDSDSSAAAEGAQRAAVLPEVLAHLERAETALGSGQPGDAEAAVQAARALDADAVQVRAMVQRVSEAQRTADYRQAVTQGYNALAGAQLEQAATAFQRALQRRPESQDAAEGLQLVQQAQTERRIQSLRQQAQAAMAAEAWQQAAEHYQAALDIDSTLAFARQGRQRALRYADLDTRIRAVLEDPGQLSDDARFERARKLLHAANGLEPPAGGFRERRQALDKLLQTVAQPVAVELQSDGATEVTVLQVERLGQFERTTLKLRPGRYTATGSRPGYRDVRVQFTVSPDQDEAIVIRTRERI